MSDNTRIVLIKDLIGQCPVTVDQRSRNADGSLKYPDQQKTPRMTTLRRVYLKTEKGKQWLYWQWDAIPETPLCNYSGLVLTSAHASNYALQVSL